MAARLRAAGLAALALVLFLLAAELTARLDDWLHQDTPPTANPDRWRDLAVDGPRAPHGRPGGRFKKWKLNEFGFRSPEHMERDPPPGVTRLMLLGASETFGLRESEGKEYPAQLAERLRQDGFRDVEVVNAAMAGITVQSLLPYWQDWAAPFRPQIVLIYPSPMLYLEEEPPRQADPGAAPDSPDGPALASRFGERVKDLLRLNPLIRKARLEWTLARQLSGKGDDWLYRDAPPDRLRLFLDDLAALTDAVRATGARPVLLTHAVRAASPMRPEDREDVREFRLFARRATEEGIVAFEDAANAGVRRLAAARDVPLIDVAAAMNGRREWFGDLVHFNDAGAAETARLLAEALEDPRRGLLPRPDAADGAR
jgi:hypothetical protein